MLETHPVAAKLPAVFVHVRDLARAAQFYTELLGLDADPQADYGNGIYVMRLANGVELLLDANHADEAQPNGTFAMHATCMFATEDIDAAHRFVVAQGAEIVTEIYRDPNVAFFNFKDPDGNIQMICQSFEK